MTHKHNLIIVIVEKLTEFVQSKGQNKVHKRWKCYGTCHGLIHL